jgi:hypothetical protein
MERRMSRNHPKEAERTPVAVLAGGAALLVVVVLLVAMSLRRPEPPTFEPTPVQPRPAHGRLIGPTLVTVDASDASRWTFFSFADGSVVDAPGPLGWDLAFRRFQVIVNGGRGFAGSGGAADLGAMSFDSLSALPADGYVVTVARSDSVNAALHRWYEYSFTSHLLTPKPHVYAIRTVDGRYAKVQFAGYYCPGAMPGCVTFRYVYQGAGGVDVGGPRSGQTDRSLQQ